MSFFWNMHPLCLLTTKSAGTIYAPQAIQWTSKPYISHIYIYGILIANTQNQESQLL